MLPREGKQQTYVCESPLPKCLGLNCVYLCLLYVFFGSPKNRCKLLAMISKGGFNNICIKQHGWEQCEVALQKVALCTRPVEGCPCENLPCQSALGLNCVYMCPLFVFLGHQKQMQYLAMISKGGFNIICIKQSKHNMEQ